MSLRPQNRYRVRTGHMSSDDSCGANGLFIVPTMDGSKTLTVIISNGGGWEHVSVSLKNRCPTWDEMQQIKRMFFEPEDTVIQFHPPDSKYINKCNTCLHMWRKIGDEYELPPPWMVA